MGSGLELRRNASRWLFTCSHNHDLRADDHHMRSAEAPSRAVDHSDHTSTEAREVTYEEAHDLLTAFLKVPPGALVKSGDMG